MVFFGLEEFGGLEEFAKDLAIGIKLQGHEISALSTAWVPANNQYVRSFAANDIRYFQPARWLSLPASDWPTKERLLARTLRLATPIIYVLAALLWLKRRGAWHSTLTSTRNWLQGQLMQHVIGPDRRKWLGQLLLEWWRLTWRFDVLHIHGYTTNLLFAIEWANRRGIPVVYEEHQTPDPQFNWWKGFEHTINKATIVAAVSEASAQGLRTVCGVTRPIVVTNRLVPDPLASNWQRPSTAGAAQPAAPLQATTVARLYVTKGLTYLLDAIVILRRRHPTARFQVYGDGPLRDELHAYARRLGLDPAAIFVGAFDHHDLPAIMRQTDLFVMSSILEGQPLALVEAMAYGCPIVATAVGGVPELIQDGVNGLLCPPHDAERLAAKIGQLLEDAALRHRLGAAARRTYEQGPFQPAAVAAHYCDLYAQAIAMQARAKANAVPGAYPLQSRL